MFFLFLDSGVGDSGEKDSVEKGVPRMSRARLGMLCGERRCWGQAVWADQGYLKVNASVGI